MPMRILFYMQKNSDMCFHRTYLLYTNSMLNPTKFKN